MESGLNISFALTDGKISIEDIATVARESSLHFNYKKHAPDLYYCEFGVRKITAKAMVISDKGYWLFVLMEDTNPSSVRSFINNVSPMLRNCHVNSNKLIDLIESMRDEYTVINLLEGSIITEYETYRRWEKEPTNFSKQISKKIEKDHRGRWSNIKLQFGNKGKSGWLKVRLYSVGALTIYSGEFNDIFTRLIINYIREGIDTNEYFSNKERYLEDSKVILTPIEIKFEEDLETKQLISLKKNISNKYLTSVVFSGNPFLLMQVIDKRDGSSYDFYAYKNKIQIVPLVKATSNSLTNLFSLTSNILPMGTIPL